MNQYPKDEFDAVPENSRREGAHRTFVRLRDPRTGIWTLVVIGVLVLIVGALMYFLVRPVVDRELGGGPASDSSSSQAPAETSDSPASKDGGSGSQGASPSDAADAASGAPDASGTGEASGSAAAAGESSDAASSDTPDAQARKDAQVGVYNASGRQGAAGRGAATLKAAGYDGATSGPWTKPATGTKVYFRDAADRELAQDVASKMNAGEPVQTANIPKAIVVVLGS